MKHLNIVKNSIGKGYVGELCLLNPYGVSGYILKIPFIRNIFKVPFLVLDKPINGDGTYDIVTYSKTFAGTVGGVFMIKGIYLPSYLVTDKDFLPTIPIEFLDMISTLGACKLHSNVFTHDLYTLIEHDGRIIKNMLYPDHRLPFSVRIDSLKSIKSI